MKTHLRIIFFTFTGILEFCLYFFTVDASAQVPVGRPKRSSSYSSCPVVLSSAECLRYARDYHQP